MLEYLYSGLIWFSKLPSTQQNSINFSRQLKDLPWRIRIFWILHVTFSTWWYNLMEQFCHNDTRVNIGTWFNFDQHKQLTESCIWAEPAEFKVIILTKTSIFFAHFIAWEYRKCFRITNWFISIFSSYTMCKVDSLSMGDEAPSHTAKSTQYWPSQSGQVSPQIWILLNKTFSNKTEAIFWAQTFMILRETLQEIPQGEIRQLITAWLEGFFS